MVAKNAQCISIMCVPCPCCARVVHKRPHRLTHLCDREVHVFLDVPLPYQPCPFHCFLELLATIQSHQELAGTILKPPRITVNHLEGTRSRNQKLST